MRYDVRSRYIRCRMIISEYTSKGFVTVSCEKDFRKLDFTEVIA